MMHFIENIFKRQDKSKRPKSIEFDLYKLSEDLFNELDRIGIIDRLKSVPQLGAIPVQRHLLKNRYEYVVLQIWLHKKAHDLVNDTLEFSYASTMHKHDFSPEFPFQEPYKNSTIEEFIQTFTLAYNVGHCHNTFLSSRALLFAMKESSSIYNTFKGQFIDQRAHALLRKLVDNGDYHHIHLLNSILILEKCNNTLFSVQLAKEMIFAYQDVIGCSDKLLYVFDLFRKIRNLSITTFDLQLDHTPFRIRLTNDNSLELFFKEYLARYNNNDKATQIVYSLTQLLSSFVYDKEERSIKTYYIAKSLGKRLIENGLTNYYTDILLNDDSLLNKKCKSSLSIDANCIKLTFNENENEVALDLLKRLDHTNHVRAAFYNRHNGHTTLVVSINKGQMTNNGLQLRILKTIISSLRRLPNIKPDDIRYLIAVKYFLSHFLNNRKISINPTGENYDICTYCLKGFNKKKNVLEQHISHYNNPGAKHEIEHMKRIIDGDRKKDISILVPSSIVVFDRNGFKKDVEFDGLIVHPFRTTGQVVFLEAKVSRADGNAKSELKKKLDRLEFSVARTSITQIVNDAYYEHNV